VRKVTIDQLKQILGDLPANPRIVASGNFATPHTLLAAADEVTEQGVADCFGHSEKQQAHNLIENAAHPDARAELRAAASKMGLL